MEAALILHNGNYLGNCVCIACSYENITVIGSCQFSDENILLWFFSTMYSIFVLDKKSKIRYYIKY